MKINDKIKTKFIPVDWPTIKWVVFCIKTEERIGHSANWGELTHNINLNPLQDSFKVIVN
jgi:hypothetical protein